MRLAKKPSLCPGGRSELDLDDEEPSVSFQLRFEENHRPGTVVWRLSISPGWKEAKPLPVCVSVLGTSLWQPPLSKTVLRCWSGLQPCFQGLDLYCPPFPLNMAKLPKEMSSARPQGLAGAYQSQL